MNEENIIIQELGGIKLSPVDDISDIFTYNSKNIRIIIQPLVTTGECLLMVCQSNKDIFFVGLSLRSTMTGGF